MAAQALAAGGRILASDAEDMPCGLRLSSTRRRFARQRRGLPHQAYSHALNIGLQGMRGGRKSRKRIHRNSSRPAPNFLPCIAAKVALACGACTKWRDCRSGGKWRSVAKIEQSGRSLKLRVCSDPNSASGCINPIQPGGWLPKTSNPNVGKFRVWNLLVSN